MKKLSLLFMFFSIVLLGGCTTENSLSTESISTNNKLSSDQMFEKKKECAGLRDKMDEQINKDSSYADCFDITETFYSPIKNSCLYVMQNRGDCGWGDMASMQMVIDYFTNEVLLYSDPSFESLLNNEYANKSDEICFPMYVGRVDGAQDYTGYNNCLRIEYPKRIKELKGE